MSSHVVTVEAVVRLEVCVTPGSNEEPAEAAKRYWHKHYEQPDDPAFLEGRYIRGTAVISDVRETNEALHTVEDTCPRLKELQVP